MLNSIKRLDVWLFELFSCVDLSDYSKALIVMLCIWKARCACVFDNNFLQPVGTMCSAVKDLDEFWAVNGWANSGIFD